MGYRTLHNQHDDEIAIITLNRPEKRNAISVADDRPIFWPRSSSRGEPARVLIITGSGKAFCAGMDLDELRSAAGQSLRPELRRFAPHVAKLFYRLYGFPKPVIAAVNGAAIAGGCGIATLADFTLAVPEAKFGYTEVKIGFIPAIVSVFLRRQIGERRRATCS